MQFSIAEATALCADTMTAIGHTQDQARIIADHLIDCELRGVGYGGLARALSICDRVKQMGLSKQPITVVQESAVSAAVDGGDQVGYLVGDFVTELAIAKVRQSGIAVVGAKETWYTGMFSYYLERITQAGFGGMIAGSGGPIVTPAGGTQGRFATNPIAFGFPTQDSPIIWDVGTSAVTLAEVILKMRLGEPLAEGLAYDPAGRPTTDPAVALAGRAFSVWGGHKGSGLALCVQLLGMMCGASAAPEGLRDCGFFVLVIDPGLLTSAENYKTRVSAYAEDIRSTRPIDAGKPVRVPFDRSLTERQRRVREGVIEVPDEVANALRLVVG